MASISQIKIGDVTYNLKDTNATEAVASEAEARAAAVTAEATKRENYIREFGVSDLADGVLSYPNATHNGISYTWNGKICTANGTSTGTSVNLLYVGDLPETLEAGGKYYLNYKTSSQSLLLRIICLDDEEELKRYLCGGDAFITIPAGTNFINIALYVAEGRTLDNETCGDIQLINAMGNEELTVNALKMYKDRKKPESIFELPDNSWYYANGATMRPLLTDAFPFSLRTSTGYVITRRAIVGAAAFFDLESTDRKEKYIGATSIVNPTNPDWKRVDIDNPDHTNAAITKAQKEDIAVQVYTEFDLSGEGWYWTDGSILQSTIEQGLHHTNRIPVLPNTKYYFSATWAHTCYGVFFDAYGNFLAPLRDTDITEYAYDIPDKERSSTTNYIYVKLYKFTTPAGAYFFAYNYHETSSDVLYRQYFSNIPIYMHSNTGNLIIKKSDPQYGYFGKRKLCVIGPSEAMIDRLRRTGNFENNGNTQTQYVVGFQEWLMPFWESMTVYGYSGASYPNYNVEQGASRRSIYARIVTDQLDLSGYDDYLFTSNSNHMAGTGSSPVGDVDGYEDLGDNTSYIGALRQMMEYIYQANPLARIYICTQRHHASTYANSESWDKIILLNEKIRKLGTIMGCTVIDLERDSGMNQHTAPKWNYDYDGTHLYTAVHANHIGNMEMGLVMRKQIVGI